jgi:flagellin-like hook-associated protein FlgL
MSTITQTSSYARYLGMVRNLGQNAESVDTLSKQLTSGVKSTDIAAYGPETQKLLDLRSELVKRTNYIQSIDTALPRVQATDKVLTALEKIAADWQSSTLMPFEPGPPSVSSVRNNNAAGMKVTVDTDVSTFNMNAQYTVTAIPSQSQENGSFDVTVTDGLGGKTTQTVNLKRTPPGDGKGWNFEISGGPGAGAVINLNFENLTAAGSSSFNVNFTQANDMRDRVEATMRDIRQYMNERFGDRYLFAGSRFDTEPVMDLAKQQKETTKVTLNGNIVETDDYFEVSINDQIFSYQVAAADTKTITFVAQQLTTLINAADPAIDMTVSTRNGVITLIGNEVGAEYDISSRIVNRTDVENSATNHTTTAATLVAPLTGQIDSFSFNGQGVDIGDTFDFEVEIGNKDDPYNLKYYNEYPTEPRDLPIYQKYTVRYTVTAEDYAAGTATTTSNVADRLRAQFNALSPSPPVTLNAAPGLPLTVTSTRLYDATNHPNYTDMMVVTPSVTNGSIANSVSVAKLPPENASVDAVPTTEPPNLPYYDSDYPDMRKNVKAWDKAKVTADDGLSLEYGVTSTDEAFQTLIEAFRKARAAASNPGSYKENITSALEYMTRAKEQLNSVHAKVASDMATLDTKKTEHKDLNNGVTEQIARIEGVDQTDVAARLSAANTALEAAYTVTAKRQSLSLLNYLA